MSLGWRYATASGGKEVDCSPLTQALSFSAQARLGTTWANSFRAYGPHCSERFKISSEVEI